jgi:hypothetical protein
VSRHRFFIVPRVRAVSGASRHDRRIDARGKKGNMFAVRMVKNHKAAPARVTVYMYKAGEIYGPDSMPPAPESLMQSMVAQGLAVEVDAEGNPVGTPASKRAQKAASVPVTDPATANPPNDPGDPNASGAPAGDDDANAAK